MINRQNLLSSFRGDGKSTRISDGDGAIISRVLSTPRVVNGIPMESPVIDARKLDDSDEEQVAYLLEKLGITGASNAVLYTTQTKTAAEKVAARINLLSKPTPTTLGTNDLDGATWTMLATMREVRPYDPEWINYREEFNAPDANTFSGAGTVANNVITSGTGFQGHLGPGIATQIPFYGNSVSVVSMSGDGDGDTVGIGLSNGDFSRRAYCYYDNNAHVIAFQVEHAGGSPANLAPVSITLTAPFKLGFTLADKSIAAWVDEGEGWRVVTRLDVSVYFDPRNPALLSNLRPYWITSVEDTGAIVIDRIEGGHGGGVGLANPNPVAWADGTPIVENGEYFFTANIPGAAGGTDDAAEIPCSIFSVFSINPATLQIKLRAQHCTLRGGLLYGEHNGNLIYDSETGLWRAFIPNWGSVTNSNGTRIRTYQYTSATSLLRGINILSNGVVLALPGANTQFDICVRKLSGTWYVAFADTNAPTGWTEFYPSLASGASLDALSLAWRDDGIVAEGLVILKTGGAWVVAAGNSANVVLYTIAGDSAGDWPNEGLPAAHPAVIPIPVGSTTEYLWLKFQSSDFKYDSRDWSWGPLQILKANVTNTGWEFPIYDFVP